MKKILFLLTVLLSGLGLGGGAILLELIELGFGDEVDRSEPLALLHLPLQSR